MHHGVYGENEKCRALLVIILREIAMQTELPKPRDSWPQTSEPMLAAVHALRFGSTKAAAVLEEATGPQVAPAYTSPAVDRPLHLLCLSAESVKGLKVLANHFAAHLESHPTESLADVCYTANTGRSHHIYRLAMTASSHTQMQEKCTAFAS